MDTLQTLLVVTMLAILAEVTYLVVKLPRQNISRRQGRPILVDTSVLIDGRIIAVAQSGFIGDTLVIPRTVIGELQFLADNADHEKRARARHGLDVVTDLQGLPTVKVEILQDGSKAEEGVDERLLTLAKRHNAAICTIDFNLNKVAVVEGIAVLNVNELAQSLRMAYLPGEKMLLELVQKGQDSHQAVGYLADGTMVVVEHANKYIGQTVEIEFIRSLQTAAGKMMFAKPAEKAQPKDKQPRNKKPTGKTPVAAPAKAEEPKQQELPQTSEELQPKKPSAFHSDQQQRGQGRRRRGQVKQHQSSQNAAQTPQDAQPSQESRPQQQRRKKAPSSAQREAALIDLVEKSQQ